MRYLVLICGLLFSNLNIGFSQANTASLVNAKDSTTTNKKKLFAFPVIYYLPETRWGIGAAGFLNFRFRGESEKSNLSQVQFSAAFTQNKQLILTTPFELYFKENLWKVKGEIAYFRYLYNFYGIGNNSLKEDRETYNANYPRIRLDFLRRIGKVFTGLRYRFDQFDIVSKKAQGMLENSDLIGKNGGTISGIGWVAQLDTRDFIYQPTKGIFAELEYYANAPFIGSDFEYHRWSLDIAKYIRLADQHTIALHLNTGHITGDPIFYDMYYFGSPKLMRGFQDRRFMDKNIFVCEAEYRFPLYKILQGVSFISIGEVGNTYDKLWHQSPKLAFGAGLRITVSKKDRTRLRIDYGRTLKEGGAFYVTINDAF